MLKLEYKEKLALKIKEKLDLKNVNAVPIIEKIVINAGIGNLKDNKNAVKSYIEDLTVITGQKPSPRAAKTAISNFKLRQGEVIGLMVTLRGDSMWAFLEKLINVVFPRIREFDGVSDKAFDDNGNYNFGIKDHTVFPEIDTNRVDMIKNFQITIVTSTKDNNEARTLLEEIGMPFKKKQ